MSGLIFDTAARQLEAVQAGEVSARELLDATIAQYERLNPSLNAVVVTQLDAARARADELDARHAAGEPLGPLHGLPVTVKEAFDLVGTPTTWGFEHQVGNVAESNAVLVQRLLDAGAIVYGKTNVPVALAEWQSFNPVYGTTNNPWDVTRTPGGSSGGSAASLAAGMAALELGSDIGASIRNPAHYCGVFGHKPTYGLLPDRGHALPGDDAPVDIAVVGPLARSAADLDLVMDVLVGPDSPDSIAYSASLPGDDRPSLSEFKVGVMLESDVVAQDDEMTGVLREAVDRLIAAGLQVEWGAQPPIDHREAHLNYQTLLLGALGVFLPDDEYAMMAEQGQRWRGGDRDALALVGYANTVTHREWWKASNRRAQYRKIWADWFDDYDLLLCPAAASAAFEHNPAGFAGGATIPINGNDEAMSDQLFWAGWSCNVYLPATVAPVGLTDSELPVGIQIVAPHLHDRRSIAFAKLVEAELGGFRVPPLAAPR